MQHTVYTNETAHTMQTERVRISPRIQPTHTTSQSPEAHQAGPQVITWGHDRQTQHARQLHLAQHSSRETGDAAAPFMAPSIPWFNQWTQLHSGGQVLGLCHTAQPLWQQQPATRLVRTSWTSGAVKVLLEAQRFYQTTCLGEARGPAGLVHAAGANGCVGALQVVCRGREHARNKAVSSWPLKTAGSYVAAR